MKRFFLSLLVAALLAWPANATWSIVVVNHKTGEVVVAVASCTGPADLLVGVPSVRVGKGAAVFQAAGDSQFIGRPIAFDMLDEGATPFEILEAWRMADPAPFLKQAGCVAFSGPADSRTGGATQDAAGGVEGSFGEYSYAIQGNILTGLEVIDACEDALIATDGDAGQKVLAAMQAGRMYGGDGRCSCSLSMPTSCGSPPPDFERTATGGFFLIARMGDTDGVCNTNVGCASGDYYLTLNVTGGALTPDAIGLLQDQYDVWRADLAGRPDHILSTVHAEAQSMPADGVTQRTVTVQLVDVEGVALTTGGADVTVTSEEGGFSTAGPVTDHGDGSYSFTLTAGTTPGTDTFVIRADDGVATATLYPYLEMRVDPPNGLHVGFDDVGSTEGALVPFVVNVPEAAGGNFLIVGSSSGTSPGFPIAGLTLPLNLDSLLIRSANNFDTGAFHDTFGALDGSGRAEGLVNAAPAFLYQYAGGHLDWSAFTFQGGVLRVTDPVGFDVGE